MREEIIIYINEVASEKGVEVNNTTDLYEYGILDSMEIILFLTYLDEKLNIKFDFSDMDAENFRTIDTILNWVKNNVCN